MDKVLLYVKEWYKTQNETILERIFDALHQSTVSYYAVCFKNEGKVAIVEDIKECRQILFTKLLKKLRDIENPILEFYKYYRSMRANVFIDYNCKLVKSATDTIDHIDPSTGQNVMDNIPDTQTVENSHRWEVVTLFLDAKPCSQEASLARQILINKMEGYDHKESAQIINQKFGLKSEKAMNANKIKNRWYRLKKKIEQLCQQLE